MPSAPTRTINPRAYATALAAVVALCAWIKHEGGLPRRLSPEGARLEASRIDATILAGPGDCMGSYADTKPDSSPRCDNIKPGRHGIAVFGDSHASTLSPAFREIAAREQRGFAFFAKASCGPFLGVRMMQAYPRGFADSCTSFMTASFEAAARRPEIDTVVLVGFWRSYGVVLGPARLYTGLLNAMQMMRAANKRVLIIDDVPVWGINPTHVVLANAAIPVSGWIAQLVWPALTVNLTDAPYRLPTAESLHIDAALRRLVLDQDVELIDLRASYCSSDLCPFQRDGTLLYFDLHHVSRFGGMQAVDALAQHLGLYELTIPASSRRRIAAVTVFSSRQAIVIGPTPPGTGVIAPATAAHSS